MSNAFRVREHRSPRTHKRCLGSDEPTGDGHCPLGCHDGEPTYVLIAERGRVRHEVQWPDDDSRQHMNGRIVECVYDEPSRRWVNIYGLATGQCPGPHPARGEAIYCNPQELG